MKKKSILLKSVQKELQTYMVQNPLVRHNIHLPFTKSSEKNLENNKLKPSFVNFQYQKVAILSNNNVILIYFQIIQYINVFNCVYHINIY